MAGEEKKPQDALPPDAGGAKTEEKAPVVSGDAKEPGGGIDEVEKQSTREWLRSLGMVAGEVATREQPRVEREAERRQVAERPRREEGRESKDTDEVVSLLREGDDERFIEGVVNLSRKRVMEDMSKTERDAAFGQQINEYVGANAPDVPLVVFWSFAGEAERRYPGAVDKQIDWAIWAGRTAMENHNAQSRVRGDAIRETQEQSETLDGTPTRPRRRGAREAEGKTTTFVEELLAARAKYE